jgi:bifunctional UDP-N-acetylglucosamine pyrophosphorylase/glucosamine-1-phosphate N-acetyltransferase
VSVPAPAAVVVLAAGEGTRMRSRTPKVLHEVAGRSLLGHVVHVARTLHPSHVVVVVGHGRERVAEHLSIIDPDVKTVVQEEQNGTGHAVRIAIDTLTDVEGTVVVLSGDSPLVTTSTLAVLCAEHDAETRAATMLAARVADPTGYGRVIRDDAGQVAGIVEDKDADDRQRMVDEVNSGMYAFALGPLREALGRLTTDNAQGEEYLTDVVGLMSGSGLSVGAVVATDPDEILGVNDRVQLAQAARVLRDRRNEELMRAGVTIIDPASTWIDVDADVAPDAVLHPGTLLRGATSVGADAVVGPRVTLVDTEVGDGAVVRDATCELAVIGPDATVGPYTYLRPGTVLGAGAKAGGFVEMKNAVVGDGSKVPHLSYVGDAEIGEGSNIGAATVFVNYDGAEKHRTVVGDAVRIGSDTMLVAPVTIGDGAYTAAGSVITEDVPPGAMAVGRARQRTIQGWTERKRPGSASARAAEAAKAADPDVAGGSGASASD